MTFDVIDKKTSKYPDLEKIALDEDWAKGLMYCDMEGFAVNEDGNLLMLDECGKFEYAPFDRFEVKYKPDWISVEERMPDRGVDVLLSMKYVGEAKKSVHEAYYDEEGYFVNTDGVIIGPMNADITHWMPMPEPFEEE